MLLILPKVKIETVKCNFVFKASLIWNAIIEKVLSNCSPNDKGIMVPGSVTNSDLSTKISIVKLKLKDVLLEIQKVDPPHLSGWKMSDIWFPANFLSCKLQFKCLITI